MTFADPPEDPWLRASATELAVGLRSREISAAELLEAVLRRADEITEPINPFAVRLDERARRAAAESDRRLADGAARPLEGLPISVKDSQWLAGVPTTSGSRARADFVPSSTVAALQRLLDAGAVLFAKTTTSEFCYTGVSTAPTFGTTGNPHDPSRTAGGSSGGAAAATAAWAGPVGLGGDGGGSIRIPAAFCGLVGHKPTFGLVPHEPSGPGWKTLVSIGPLTRSVADAELLLDVLAGYHPDDRHSTSEPPAGRPEQPPIRVAVSPDLGFAALDEEVATAFGHAVDALSDAGVQVVPADPGRSSSVEIWASIATAEARWSEATEYEQHPELLSAAVRDYLAFGEQVGAERYIRAQFERERIHAAYARVLRRDRHRRAVHPDRRLRRVRQRTPVPGPDRRRRARRRLAGLGPDALRRQPRRAARLQHSHRYRGRAAHRGPPAGPPAVRPPVAARGRLAQPRIESPHRSPLTGSFPVLIITDRRDGDGRHHDLEQGRRHKAKKKAVSPVKASSASPAGRNDAPAAAPPVAAAPPAPGPQDAARCLGDPGVLPAQQDADLLRLADLVQPARGRPVDQQLHLRQLLRLLRRRPPAGVRSRRARGTTTSPRWRR